MNKWDLYNRDFVKIGKIVDENETLEDNEYHLSINCWIINSKKQVLLLRSKLNYNLHYPGFWRGINGNVLSGKTSVETVIESIYNKIGIKIDETLIKEVGLEFRDPYHYIYNTFIVNLDFDSKRIKFLDETIIQAKWADLNEVYNMIENGEIAWVLIPRIEEYVIPLMK